MNKFFLSGLLALGAVLASQHEAKAWLNFKFGAGINWHWQSGGNNFLWGVFKNGQPPGPDGPGPGFHHPHVPGSNPFPGSYGPQEFQFFGHPGMAPAPYGGQRAYAPAYAPAYGPAPAPYAGANPYQPVSYNPYATGYQQPLNFSYPGYYGYTYAPTYWYGHGR